jgi:hypothetical protein
MAKKSRIKRASRRRVQRGGEVGEVGLGGMGGTGTVENAGVQLNEPPPPQQSTLFSETRAATSTAVDALKRDSAELSNTVTEKSSSIFGKATDYLSGIWGKLQGEDVNRDQEQVGGKRKRLPRIRLNRKYISKKMSNIVDIFKKHITRKNKGKKCKKSRRNYRGGSVVNTADPSLWKSQQGSYPQAVGSINVPIPPRP